MMLKLPVISLIMKRKTEVAAAFVLGVVVSGLAIWYVVSKIG